ncbi:MAG: hypothetical protein QOI23_1426 [Chloroflexota bacterium]|nr:hypothetical protein [Chloroflexota bacterium]
MTAHRRSQERPQKNSHDRAMCFARVAGMFAQERPYAAADWEAMRERRQVARVSPEIVDSNFRTGCSDGKDNRRGEQ